MIAPTSGRSQAALLLVHSGSGGYRDRAVWLGVGCALRSLAEASRGLAVRGGLDDLDGVAVLELVEGAERADDHGLAGLDASACPM